MIDFWSILGSHWGPFWSQKGGNKGSQKRPLFKYGSWGGPGVDFGWILDDFGSYFVMILVCILDIFGYSDLCV